LLINLKNLAIEEEFNRIEREIEEKSPMNIERIQPPMQRNSGIVNKPMSPNINVKSGERDLTLFSSNYETKLTNLL